MSEFWSRDLSTTSTKTSHISLIKRSLSEGTSPVVSGGSTARSGQEDVAPLMNSHGFSDEEVSGSSELNRNDSVVRGEGERPGWKVIGKQGVSIRAGPHATSTLIGVLNHGTLIHSIEKRDRWLRHKRGWSPMWDTYCDVVFIRKMFVTEGKSRLQTKLSINVEENAGGSIRFSNRMRSDSSITGMLNLSKLDLDKASQPAAPRSRRTGRSVSPFEPRTEITEPLPLFTPTRVKKDGDVIPSQIGLPMMRAPQLLRNPPEAPEPFYVYKGGSQNDLKARKRREFMERVASSSGKPNVVYDSMLKPPNAGKGYLEPDAEGRLRPYYVPSGPEDTTLVFESRFESGNLRKAVKVSESEYDLLCRPDINTNSYAQWFYFSVSNTKAKARYRFNIINMLKSDSLFNQGMQPIIYSTTDAKESRKGWYRGGSDVCYYRHSGKFHCATFSIKPPHDNDTLYIAYCYPYTYTDLQADLRRMEETPSVRQFLRRRVLCSTICGNDCDVLTITDFQCSQDEMRAKPAVVASARVHPGESNASWMMKGLLDFLTGPSKEAKQLRQRFLFKIVPMLNPDGVVLGNYRCSLSGVDLNRHWLHPSKEMHPTIFHIKNLIKRLACERELLLTTDIHGHSKAMNLFMYGCHNNNNSERRLEERVFPYLLDQACPAFRFQNCHFKIKKSKASTARVVVWREANLITSYTMEASFAGCNQGKWAGVHFTAVRLKQIGEMWCRNILRYADSKTKESAKSDLLDMYPTGKVMKEEVESGADSDPDSADEAEDNPPDHPTKLGGIDLGGCGVQTNVRRLMRRSRKKTNKKHKKEKKQRRGASVGNSRSYEDDAKSARRRPKNRKSLYQKPVRIQRQISLKEKKLKEKEKGWGRRMPTTSSSIFSIKPKVILGANGQPIRSKVRRTIRSRPPPGAFSKPRVPHRSPLPFRRPARPDLPPTSQTPLPAHSSFNMSCFPFDIPKPPPNQPQRPAQLVPNQPAPAASPIGGGLAAGRPAPPPSRAASRAGAVGRMYTMQNSLRRFSMPSKTQMRVQQALRQGGGRGGLRAPYSPSAQEGATRDGNAFNYIGPGGKVFMIRRPSSCRVSRKR